MFYDASPTGTFNTILGWVGLGPYPWFQDRVWAMPSIVALATWSAAGATVIIYLAALTGVNSELYEAAEVDGASFWRKIWHVTLPQLRTVLFVTLILQLIGTLQIFTEPFLLTEGGPANSTLTVMLLVFRYAFGAGGGGDYGAAAALSLMLAGFLAVFTAVYFRRHTLLVESVIRGILSPVDLRRADRALGGCASSTGCSSWCSSSSPSGRCCGWPSRPCRRPRTRCAIPLSLWPSGFDFENLVTAWQDAQIGRYFFNTVKIAVGSWAAQLVVAVTGGYVLGILRPWYAPILTGAVLVTLFVPPIVLLVPLFLTVLDLPIVGTSLLNSYWGIWLPAGASAFNVVLVKRFMENLPNEIIEAAHVDGAGPFRLLWSIVLPLSKPVIGVVSVFAVLLTWKDYLWPLVVLPDPAIQPLSVRLPLVRDTLQLDVFLAALAISMVLPIGLFVVFRRFFLSGEAMGGAIKG